MSDHCEQHIKGPLDEHGLTDTARNAGEERVRDAWETDRTIDQQHQQLGLLPSESVNLDKATHSPLLNWRNKLNVAT